MIDVAIVGGGPAGCATALSLRTHAPDLSVALIEQTNYESPRPGEVLSGAARQLLENLGIRQAFESQAWRPVYAVAAAWGGPVLSENHAIFSGPGHGWHLDRAKFDLFLARQAEARGVLMYRGVRIDPIEGLPVPARFVVDATGRAASIARRMGLSPKSFDPLLGFSRFFPEVEDSDPRTLVEAAPDGWWYTAALTGNVRVATFMTDPDIAREQRLDRQPNWHAALRETRFVSAVVPDCASVGDAVRPAGSACLENPAGETWLATGDAACAHDPLSGQGITRSLRSGILASYAIADLLCKGTAEGIERYRMMTQHGWCGYLSARERFYREEQRWNDRPFWQKRHGALANGETAPFGRTIG